MESRKIAFIFGTRPEAIKLAPLVRAFRERAASFSTVLIATAQHREMLDQVLDLFKLTPDYDLGVMTPDQTLGDLTSRMVAQLERILARESPHLVVVQGDTTTTFVGALAAFYCRIPVAHVEAGLRTGNRLSPFPEEINRRLTSVIADLHFAATESARTNLIREGISEALIHVTGNTVIDALFWVLAQPYNMPASLARLFARKKAQHVLVTVHRRESHGEPLRRVCKAVLNVAEVMPDVEIIFHVHPSPQVRPDALSLLRGRERVHLLPPLDYQSFVHLMQRARLILTDSGGVQEEAPALGIPLLVLREETERPEAVLAGVAEVVGTDPAIVTRAVQRWLSRDQRDGPVAGRISSYGDGHACARIVNQIERYFAGAAAMDSESVRHEVSAA